MGSGESDSGQQRRIHNIGSRTSDQFDHPPQSDAPDSFSAIIHPAGVDPPNGDTAQKFAWQFPLSNEAASKRSWVADCIRCASTGSPEPLPPTGLVARYSGLHGVFRPLGTTGPSGPQDPSRRHEVPGVLGDVHVSVRKIESDVERDTVALSTHLRVRSLLCLGGALLAVSASYAQKPDLDAILAATADYIARYEREVVAVVAQEDYRQRVASATLPSRQLRSDLVIIANENRGWLEFRDVFEVDGRSVRDHDDRIAQLFLKSIPTARQQAASIVAESARFNLNPPGVTFERTLNIPLEALRFLRKMNQSRSQFDVAGEERTDVGKVVVLKFREQAMPRLISSPLDEAASGRFWIEPVSGAVVRSELTMSAPNVSATITVTYARQLSPAVWLPASMDENYRLVNGTVALSGHAIYSHFRRFQVDVLTDIKETNKPPLKRVHRFAAGFWRARSSRLAVEGGANQYFRPTRTSRGRSTLHAQPEPAYVLLIFCFHFDDHQIASETAARQRRRARNGDRCRGDRDLIGYALLQALRDETHLRRSLGDEFTAATRIVHRTTHDTRVADAVHTRAVHPLPAHPYEIAQSFNTTPRTDAPHTGWPGAVHADVAGLGDKRNRVVAREADDAGRNRLFLSWNRNAAPAQHTRPGRTWADDGGNALDVHRGYLGVGTLRIDTNAAGVGQ